MQLPRRRIHVLVPIAAVATVALLSAVIVASPGASDRSEALTRDIRPERSAPSLEPTQPTPSPPTREQMARVARTVTRPVVQRAAATTPARVPSGYLLLERFGSYPLGQTWQQGGSYGPWRVRYHGYGRVWTRNDGGSAVLALSPKAADDPGETHAGLVTTRKSYGDIDVSVRARTADQLRTPSANTWEVPWLVWNYTDDTHFYYLVLKPNGWELGKEDPAYPGAQRFLATGGGSTYRVGAWHTLRARQVGNTITVWGNGTRLATVTDRERPYDGGAVGLYTEDAEVSFDDVRVKRPT